MKHVSNSAAYNSELNAFHHTKIKEEHLKPIQVIIPILLFLMIIMIMCLFAFFQRKRVIDNAEQVTNQMAEYIAGNIANEMAYAKSSIKFAASSVSQSMTSGELEHPEDVILPMVENTPFGGIEYIRADGMNVMTIGEPFDASNRIYYMEGIQGHTGVWNNYHPKTSKETLMNYYTPLLYQGEIVGVLTGYIAATTQIAPLFETQLYGQEIFGLLVDENDMVICSTFQAEYIKNLTLSVFLNRFGYNGEQKNMFTDIIHEATEVAASYQDPAGGGRISVVTIPGTEWKIAIIVPKSSVDDFVNQYTRNSVITMILISVILIIYATSLLVKNMLRRKEIAIQNEQLELANQRYDEENKQAIREISIIKDIIASANMGTWRIELIDGKMPRMFVDDTMENLLGLSGKNRTPEETYDDWFRNITPEALPSVLESVEKMKDGKNAENTYLWMHPYKGVRYVRCGGTAQKIPGGFLLSGYHYDVDEVVREDQAKAAMKRP